MTWFTIVTWVFTAGAITGVILNIKKKRSCFYIWTVTNGAWAIVDFAKGIPAQGVLFTVYFGLAIWGIIEWKADKK